jgi:hypothetical protein
VLGFNTVRDTARYGHLPVAAPCYDIHHREGIDGPQGRGYNSSVGAEELFFKDNARDSVIVSVAEGDKRRGNAPFCSKSFRRS